MYRVSELTERIIALELRLAPGPAATFLWQSFEEDMERLKSGDETLYLGAEKDGPALSPAERHRVREKARAELRRAGGTPNPALDATDPVVPEADVSYWLGAYNLCEWAYQDPERWRHHYGGFYDTPSMHWGELDDSEMTEWTPPALEPPGSTRVLVGGSLAS